MTSRTIRKACLAAALTAATGGVLALGSGGIVRVAVDDYSTNAPAKPAPAMPGRTEGDHDARPSATTSMQVDKAEDKAEGAVSDSTITTKIKTKLLLTMKDLKSAEGVHVKTKDGIVNVSGTVPSKEQHDIALVTIRSVDGVRSIHDSLKISSR